MTPDEKRRFAAYHEAGHAVIAHVLGAHVKSVKIGDAGEGDVDITFDITTEKKLIIAAAGPLAEVKGSAQIAWNGEPSFDLTVGLSLLTKLARTPDSLGECQLILPLIDHHGKKRPFTVSDANTFNDFDFDEEECRKKECLTIWAKEIDDDGSLLSIFHDSAAKLDSQRVWMVLQNLVVELLCLGYVVGERLSDLLDECHVSLNADI